MDDEFALFGAGLAGLGIVLVLMYIVALAAGVVTIIAMWKVFKKAGKNGWEAIVPVYNIITLLQILGINPIWFLGLGVPILNLVILIAIAMRLAQGFGKDGGFIAGLILLEVIFLSILGFGKDTWDASKIDKNTFSFLNDKNAPAADPAAPAAAPVAPAEPVAPVAPAEPVTPVAPAEPATPVAPEPVQPTAPAQPTAPVAPSEPTTPEAPTTPQTPTPTA